MPRNKVLLFVSDMDGTLLQEDFTISPVNLAAIRRLEAAGIRFAIATGRTHYDAETICRKHALEPYIISNNGACVFHPDGTLLSGKALDKAFVSGIVDFLEQEKICYGLGESGGYIAPANWTEVFDSEIARLRAAGMVIPEEKIAFAKQETQKQHGVRIVEKISEYLEQGEAVYSISLITYDKEALQKAGRWASRYKGTAVCISGTHNAEIMYQDCTKGKSLEFLCGYLNIPLSQTAVAGDSLNDLDMFEKAGFGFAMGNGREEIKEAAAIITKPCREDGLAEAVEHLLQQNI